MDFQHFIDTIFGTVLTGLIAFGAWIVKQVNSKPDRAEVRELIQDKNQMYTVYVQELKEDIKRLEEKLDKLLDKLGTL